MRLNSPPTTPRVCVREGGKARRRGGEGERPISAVIAYSAHIPPLAFSLSLAEGLGWICRYERTHMKEGERARLAHRRLPFFAPFLPRRALKSPQTESS